MAINVLHQHIHKTHARTHTHEQRFALRVRICDLLTSVVTGLGQSGGPMDSPGGSSQPSLSVYVRVCVIRLRAIPSAALGWSE